VQTQKIRLTRNLRLEADSLPARAFILPQETRLMMKTSQSLRLKKLQIILVAVQALGMYIRPMGVMTTMTIPVRITTVTADATAWTVTLQSLTVSLRGDVQINSLRFTPNDGLLHFLVLVMICTVLVLAALMCGRPESEKQRI
jgi:magnesium-transporting ATPase (P-type)